MRAAVLRLTTMHTDFTLTAADEHLLGKLVGTRVRQIVWDLNALYLVGAGEALKVEVLADVPPTEVRPTNTTSWCMSTFNVWCRRRAS